MTNLDVRTRVRAILVALTAMSMLLLPRPAVAADVALPGQVVAKLSSAADLASVQSLHGLHLLRRLGPRPIYLFSTFS